jgi:glycogen debranching enzyme
MAPIYEELGDFARAAKLRQSAEQLRIRFEEKFWLPAQQFYALGLHDGGKPLRVITSNPGHALWCGIAAADRAKLVAERLMAPDMFSGWGIRTLASSEKSYNPVGYHLGTVWPHDNGLIAIGMKNYGFHHHALRIADSLFEAATNFEHGSVPELFCGFPRQQSLQPVRYPVACHPQAWGAATPLFLLTHLLGISPQASHGRLRIAHPMLPKTADWITLKGLRVGHGTADLRFTRTHDGHATVEVMATAGDIEVVVEP